MRPDVKEIYRWVVDDVVEKVREMFAQEGVEPTVLEELRSTWFKKLEESGVMGNSTQDTLPSIRGASGRSATDLQTPPPARARASPRRTPDPRSVTAQDVSHTHSHTHAQTAPLPRMLPSTNHQHVDPASLQQVPTVALAVPHQNRLSHPTMIIPQEYSSMMANAQYIQWGQQQAALGGYMTGAPLSMFGNFSTITSGQIPRSGGQVLGAPVSQSDVRQPYIVNGGMQIPAVGLPSIQPGPVQKPDNGTVAVGSSTPGVVPETGANLLKPGMKRRVPEEAVVAVANKAPRVQGVSIPQRDGADDSKEVGTASKDNDPNEGGEGEKSGGGCGTDNLGSDEELLTDEDDDVDENTTNMLTAQYDKVSRIKNRWRCQLKFGIFHADGRDYLFKTANGEFEF